MAVEAICPINFTQPNNRFVLSLQYNGSNSTLFVIMLLIFYNDTKRYQFKAKDSERKDYALRLRNITKDFTVNDLKKTGLKRILNFFSIDFSPIYTNNILDIRKYLMKETWCKIMFGLIKKIYFLDY